MLERHFLLRFVRLGLEIGSGLALNVGATYLTGGAAAIPLGIMLVGAAASLLAAKATTDKRLSAAEQAEAESDLARLTEKYHSLRATIDAIANGTETSNTFSRESAQALLALQNQTDAGPDLPDDALLIYVGEWIERWCNEHSAKVEDVQKAVDENYRLLKLAVEKIDQASEENRAAHEETQALVKRVRYFVRFDQYVRPLFNHSRLFRHDWALVGRGEALAALVDFIQSGSHQVGILCGRGGIGKSKLLITAVQQVLNSGWSGPVYFVPEHVPLAQITEAELPAAGSIVVVDDAHRYEDLAALLELLNVHSPDVRVLVATRPHAFDYLKSTVVGAKYDVTQIRVFQTLENLSKADIKLLAEQTLGPKFKHLSDQIVDSTWDSPLVTVIAGQLVEREALSPRLLETKTEFRDTVLARFRDEMLGLVDVRVPAADCIALLEVLAAIAPANTSDEGFIDLAAKFTDSSGERVVRALAAMEAAGLLLRRGNTVRITPDVLADYLLNDACVKNGSSTGFADRVFFTFFERFPDQVLKNLAELDWRNKHAAVNEFNVLEQIWLTIEQDYKTAAFDRQLAILKVLKGIAYIQPQHVLPLVEYSIRETAATPATNDDDFRWKITAADVARQIPSVLREISYRLDYLSHCCDLLWKLGREDRRSLNSNPDHPIRILQDIASYEQHKLLQPHEIILERGLAWLDETDCHKCFHSPLEVLQKLLAKDGHSSFSKGHAIHFSPFLVEAKVTQSIRQSVISRLKVAMRGNDPRLANEAAKSLGNFLLPPHPPFGLTPTKEQCEQWVPEQQDVLDDMVKAFEECLDPVRRIQIAAALPMYIRRGRGGGDRERLRQITATLLTDPNLRRLRSIMETWKLDVEDDEDDADDWKAKAERQNAERDQIVRELIASHPTADGMFRQLIEDVKAMKLAEIATDTWNFFNAIGRVDSGYGVQLARLIWNDPNCPLLGRSDVLLAHYRASNPNEAGVLLAELARSDEVSIRRLSAQFLRTSGCLNDPSPTEIAVLDILLVDVDDVTREAATWSLVVYRAVDARGAIDRALSVTIGSNPGLAQRVCDVLMADHQTLHVAVTDADLLRLIQGLLPVASIEEYHISQLIKEAAKRIPEAVVEFALARVAYERGDLRYQPLPHGAELLDAQSLAQLDGYPKVLRRVRDAVLADGATSFWLPKLYAVLSGHFTQVASIEVLAEGIETKDADQLQAVSTILREAGRTFIFDHQDVVRRMLERSFELGDDCYESVRHDLYGSALYGERTGFAGQPFPQDVQARDSAKKILKTCMPGSKIFDFYELVRKATSENISRALTEAELEE